MFDLIVRRATELCNVPAATLFEFDGELVHIRSDYRSETILAPSALAAYVQLFPMRPTRGSIYLPGDPGSADHPHPGSQTPTPNWQASSVNSGTDRKCRCR